MSTDRRAFLTLAGGCALALAGRAARQALAAPQSSPAQSRRWAMVIDAQKCLQQEGCRKCVQACHQAHNVPAPAEPRHEVKWIWKEAFEHAFPSEAGEHLRESLRGNPVLVFCNHCDQPPCVRVCPTQATWKRAEDGLVMMDWHRCIGCRYCVAACPYGSRSFNWVDPRPHLASLNAEYPTRTKGVVEKCTFCEERLEQGRPPACVEACPEKALVFGDLRDPASEVRRLLRARYTLRRKPELGTQPQIYYIV